MKLLEVAVAAPLHQTLTYKAIDHPDPLQPGTRLLVPLGRRLVTGYLLGDAKEPPSATTIKTIKQVLDPSPIFPAEMVELFRWMAHYYHYPIGEIIKAALPSGLTRQSSRWLELTTAGETHLPDSMDADRTEWAMALCDKKKLSVAATRKIWNSKERGVVLQWAERGWLTIREEVCSDSTGRKTEVCVTWDMNQAEQNELPLKPSEKKTLALLKELLGRCDPIPKRDIVQQYPGARNALKSLAEKKMVRFIDQPVYRDPFGESITTTFRPETLSVEQEQALISIKASLLAGQFNPFLLHGVTGSGKTEVYLRAAETALSCNKTVLLLVPEIALAAQIEAHFLDRFGDQVALLHSGLSKGERFDQWHRILHNEASIVIGARSGIFAPLSNLGLLIVDEEHDSAYKQEDGLRYHARDLAILRACQCRATVILGSATPSLTSYTNAEKGKYSKLLLAKRIEDRPLPTVELIDLQAIKTVSGTPPLFSPQLTTALRQNLKKGEQSLIFLNRRGFANLMLCKQCGQTIQCRDCHISMTFHQHTNQLLCHYCGHTSPGNILCGNCNSTEFIHIGFGTERLEKELAGLFPDARLARLDRDTTRKRTDFIRILKSVHQEEVDILIGTQMITKGHHFPNVTLVGIVWADAGLGMPDFKAGERTFQLLSQVTGRAGRGEKPGRVIIQTHQPDHYAVIAARDHNFTAFYQHEMETRRQLGFPPFSRLINLCFESENETSVRSAANTLAQQAHKWQSKYGVKVLGPAPALLSKLRGKYRWQLLLQGAQVEKLHAILQTLMNNPPPQISANMVKMTVDVDPESMV